MYMKLKTAAELSAEWDAKWLALMAKINNLKDKK